MAVNSWDDDETWAEESDRTAQLRAERRAQEAEREALASFGTWRAFLSGLPTLLVVYAIAILAAIWSFSSAHRIPFAWISGGICSLIAVCLTFILVRAVYRLVRTGSTAKRPTPD